VTDATEIRFDDWTLRPRSGELLRAGQTQRLPQQPLRVLIELLGHPGEVVTREQLVQALWPKGVVDFDNNLNSIVRKLRVALEDDSETPRYIETLPRIGYRFVGTLQSQPPVPERSRARWVVIPLAVGVVLLAGAVGWWQTQRAPPAAASTAAPGRTTNQHAYQLYLDGKFHRSRRDVNGNPVAIERFEEALREDPYFADAWAALAETYVGVGTQQQVPLAVAMEQSRSAALRAIELDPKLAAGHSALGSVLMYYDFDYAGAEKQYIEARAADERYARLWYAYGLLRAFQGRTDEAIDYMGRARELEPMTLLYTAGYANLLYYTRKYAEAIEYVRPVLASQPRFDQLRTVLIRSLIETGDLKDALDQLSLRYSDMPMLSDDGLAYARAGRREDAVRQVERLERHQREGYGVSYEIAIIHAALGQTDEACTALRGALADHSPTLNWLQLDPRMESMRKAPCYMEVARRLYQQ
jgi:DNA-binding winged helix-turn-helix (wHTH) protein/tetratricopeptide (TPR) repeat protein